MGWQTVGEYVRRERKHRQQTQADFARSLGISVSLLGAIESGRRTNYEPGTVSVIEYELGWAPGSVDDVVQGRKPKPAGDALFTRLQAAWRQLPPDARRMLVQLAELFNGQD